MKTLDDDRVLGDLVAAGNATECANVGLIGFCMGGMYALKAAGLSHFHRVVAFYGMIRVPEAWKGFGTAEPLDKLANPLSTPTLAIIGEQDPYTPPEDVDGTRGERGSRWCAIPRPSTGSCTIPTGLHTGPPTPPTRGSARSRSRRADPQRERCANRSRLTMR